MTIYVYRCSSCGCTDEIDHPMSDSYEGVVCNRCEVGAMRKVFFPTSAIFRGSGWGKDS